MRDINEYQKNYIIQDFEQYKVMYRRRKIIEYIELYKPRRILEIGCGMEPLFQYLGGSFEKYIFYEPGDIFYKNAIEKINNDRRIIGRNKPFLPDESLREEHFDFIVCASLLHELDDPHKMIQDIGEIADRNTIIHFNVPNADSFHRKLAMAMGIAKDVKELSERNKRFQQHNVFDLPSLSQLIKNCGFEIIEKGDFFIKPFTHKQMFEMVNYGILSKEILDGLYNLSNYIPGIGSEIFVNCRKYIFSVE